MGGCRAHPPRGSLSKLCSLHSERPLSSLMLQRRLVAVLGRSDGANGAPGSPRTVCKRVRQAVRPENSAFPAPPLHAGTLCTLPFATGLPGPREQPSLLLDRLWAASCPPELHHPARTPCWRPCVPPSSCSTSSLQAAVSDRPPSRLLGPPAPAAAAGRAAQRVGSGADAPGAPAPRDADRPHRHRCRRVARPAPFAGRGAQRP